MLLLSIHPQHVERIFAGTKTVELRKRKPNVALNTEIVIYATMPEGKIVGTATISKIDVYSPQYLWKINGKDCGVKKSQFDTYFSNSDRAVGIHLKHAKPLKFPLTLKGLRDIWPDFHPPQQFRYLDKTQVRTLLGKKYSSITQT